MNDRIPAGGGGERRRRYELLACTEGLEAPPSARSPRPAQSTLLARVSVAARSPRSACSKLLARAAAATAPRDAGVRAVNAPDNVWQVMHARELGRRTGGRT